MQLAKLKPTVIIYNTDLETGNPDIINHPGNAEKMEMD
jgi:hypothetical protein